MPSGVMSSPRTEPMPRLRGERSVEEIIDRARSVGAPRTGAVMLAIVSAALLWASFTPLDWGPLAWVSLVPLIQLIRIPQPTRWMYRIVFWGGLLCALVQLQWMRLGDLWMYPAWMSLAVYLGLYFPLFVALSRLAVHRWKLPLTLTVPVAWVGLEFARGRLMGGFPWYLLGHSQYQWTTFVQVSDLFGAYGPSFVVALGNAVLAMFVPLGSLKRLRLLPFAENGSAGIEAASRRGQILAVASMLAVLAGVLVYGSVRRSQANFEPGPRVALIQGNFTSSLKHDEHSWRDMYRTHYELTGLTVSYQPDVIVWPETMFTWPLLSVKPGMTDRQLQDLPSAISARDWRGAEVPAALLDLAEQSGSSMILGLEALDATPGEMRRYNSAVLVERERGVAGRYDKLHLVPFGEYVPLADALPWLRQVFSFARAMQLSAGERIHVFSTAGYRFVPLICFEDTVPQLAGEMVAAGERGGESVDCLVNLTNDGWFHGSSELDQHLITASFRCIETRTPMIRAVNTGISAIIDGDGRVRDPEVFIDYDARRSGQEPRTTIRDPESGRYHKQLNAALIGTVPLDARRSLYARWGDWFAALCAAACIVIALSRWIARTPTPAPQLVRTGSR